MLGDGIPIGNIFPVPIQTVIKGRLNYDNYAGRMVGPSSLHLLLLLLLYNS